MYSGRVVFQAVYVEVCVGFCLCTPLVGRGRMRSHPSRANSHQSGPMLEPKREEAIAHSAGAHSHSTQGGQGHLTHQGPHYFSFSSRGMAYIWMFLSLHFAHGFILMDVQSLAQCSILSVSVWGTSAFRGVVKLAILGLDHIYCRAGHPSQAAISTPYPLIAPTAPYITPKAPTLGLWVPLAGHQLPWTQLAR